MKIDIPRIVRRLDLGDYAQEMKDAHIFMWVNPPRAKRRELYMISRRIDWVAEAAKLLGPAAPPPMPPQGDIEPNPFEGLSREDIESKADEIQAQLCAWWAEMWSQGEPETHWTQDEVKTLFTTAGDTDPVLIAFIRSGCLQLMNGHIEGSQKN